MFPRQDWLSSVPPPPQSLSTESEASAGEPGAVDPPAGNHLEGPRLLMKTAEMWGSVGALGPRKNPF